MASRVEAVCRALGLDGGTAAVPSVRAAMEALSEQGLLDLPALARGADLGLEDVRQLAATMKSLAARSGALSSIYLVNAVIGAGVLASEATEEQRTVLLSELRDGRLELAFAMTEPEAGSDAASLRTEAIREGDAYVLNGEKIYSTGAASASWIIVVARVASPAPRRSFGLFLVPPSAAGLTIEPLSSTRGDVHASCRIVLKDVRVPAEDAVGGEARIGKAWDLLRRVGLLERIAVAAMASGLAGSVVERATQFARERKQFDQPIATFQAIQHMLVDMHIAQTAMAMFVERAVEAFGSPSSAEAAAMAKCFCAEQLQTIVGQGMRVMGGRAFFEFEEMARYYREAPFTLYAGGTSEIQKMLVARGLGLVA